MDIINTISDLFQSVIGNLILYILALITLCQVLDHNGINVPWHSNNLRLRERERIKFIQEKTLEHISHLYKEEYKLLLKYEDERIAHLDDCQRSQFTL